ncbi:methyltransferase domain-containing protein [Acidisphaera sp. S103]|uniref:methyltransferase domain-containing protein n=1 Tax=Acidisphaera sp. S103 TaxID=1747223 RepID=UPI00131ECF5C|nr:methyltransferase domain-containing protein [Acidisphaera sp. S103]
MHLGDRPTPPRLGVVAPVLGEPAAQGFVQSAGDDAVVPGSIYNMPLNSGAHDLRLCVDVLAAVSERAAALDHLLRPVGPGGLLVIATPLTAVPSAYASGPDAAALSECLGEAALFEPDAIVASAAPVKSAGAAAMKGTASACLCLCRPGPETAKPPAFRAETAEVG